MTAVPIGIAVVEQADRFLVGTRPAETVLAGFAEFPGGKCLPGETAEACAVRECFEETDLDVEPVCLLEARTWTYPHGTVALSFVLCRPTDPRARPREPFHWVPRSELATLRFPDANRSVIGKLMEGGT